MGAKQPKNSADLVAEINNLRRRINRLESNRRDVTLVHDQFADEDIGATVTHVDSQGHAAFVTSPDRKGILYPHSYGGFTGDGSVTLDGATGGYINLFVTDLYHLAHDCIYFRGGIFTAGSPSGDFRLYDIVNSDDFGYTPVSFNSFFGSYACSWLHPFDVGLDMSDGAYSAFQGIYGDSDTRHRIALQARITSGTLGVDMVTFTRPANAVLLNRTFLSNESDSAPLVKF